jgi:23S rRNA (guanosine2251-2'-O)-methyltransferase
VATRTRKQRPPRERLFGINPVAEALRGKRQLFRLLVRSDRRDDVRISSLVKLAEDLRIPVEPADRRQLDAMTGDGNHQGVILESGPFRYVGLDQLIENAGGRPVLVLDRLQDPQNLATLIRTAAAVDIAGIVIQTDRSATVTPAVVRSSAGLVEHLAIARENNTRRAIEELKDAGYWAIALESTDTSQDLYATTLPEPVVLVVGSEERGIAPNVLKTCDLVVTLPMPGHAESLNVAVAGSVALYELLRRSQSTEQL